MILRVGKPYDQVVEIRGVGSPMSVLDASATNNVANDTIYNTIGVPSLGPKLARLRTEVRNGGIVVHRQ